MSYMLRIIQEYFEPKIGRKNKNAQPGAEQKTFLQKEQSIHGTRIVVFR